MTALQVIQTTQTLLDDNRAWFPILQGSNYARWNELINYAQLRTIKKYYTVQDERALRTLCAWETGRTNGSDIGVNAPVNIRLLFPRALLITNGYTIHATYKPHAFYINYVTPVTGMPCAAYYTITQEYSARYGMVSRVLFNTGGTATIYYIKEPAPFSYDPTLVIPDVTLELPPEYHFEVCCLVAEMINDLDVNEAERGEPVYQNQTLNIKDLWQ